MDDLLWMSLGIALLWWASERTNPTRRAMTWRPDDPIPEGEPITNRDPADETGFVQVCFENCPRCKKGANYRPSDGSIWCRRCQTHFKPMDPDTVHLSHPMKAA